ncbi:MAG: hypothetical protein H0U23_03150, partial [Blastocatellia bacterium]|nr:hypothetical protein [Blastocatellia bacterium]
DPLGYPDGPDAYQYALGDPVNKVDPLGLYSIEVHFYMTFFLARIAGIGEEEALTIALATQFIDHNPATAPIPALAWRLLSPTAIEDHNNRLRLYHFMEGLTNSSSSLDGRTHNPQSAQLTNLRSASTRAPTPCARAQLFGEFLHAFEDTFSHRDQNNMPIGLNIGQVVPGVAAGHILYGTSPDRTFDHSSIFSPLALQRGVWFNNESRTLRMEQEVFAQLSSYSGRAFLHSTTGRPIENSETGLALTYQDLFDDRLSTGGGWLVQWNRLQSTDEQIFFLEEKIRVLGLGALPLYSVRDAAERRNRFLCSLRQADYPGTILPVC